MSDSCEIVAKPVVVSDRSKERYQGKVRLEAELVKKLEKLKAGKSPYRAVIAGKKLTLGGTISHVENHIKQLKADISAYRSTIGLTNRK